MSRRNRVGIVVDHPTRDLPGAVLVAHGLASKGVAVFLIPFYDQQVDVPHLALDLIVLNYARPVNLGFARRCHEAGIMVAILDTEGGLLPKSGPNSPRSLADFVASSGFSRVISAYFCWGRTMAEALLADSGLAPEAVLVTGCPRFDLARNAADAAGGGGDYILVNMNFPLINNRFATDGKEDRRSMKSAGFDAEGADQLIRQSRLVRAAMVEAVTALAGDFPHKRFLVRPHPFERTDYYEKCFAGLANVAVSDRGSALEAIAPAEALLHVNCTTAVEAVICGVLPIAVEYGNQPILREAAWLAGQVSRNARDYEHLAAMVADVAGEMRSFDLDAIHRAHIEPYFHLPDGKAHDRVVQEVLKLLRRKSHSGPLPARRRSARRDTALQSAYSALAGLIGSRLAGRLRASIQRKRRGKGFGVRDVTMLIRRFEQADGTAPATVRHARSRLSGARLASIGVEAPAGEPDPSE